MTLIPVGAFIKPVAPAIFLFTCQVRAVVVQFTLLVEALVVSAVHIFVGPVCALIVLACEIYTLEIVAWVVCTDVFWFDILPICWALRINFSQRQTSLDGITIVVNCVQKVLFRTLCTSRVVKVGLHAVWVETQRQFDIAHAHRRVS